MLEQFSRRLFGFDVFISFALTGEGRSTRAYAADLAHRLRSKDVTTFFSEDEMRGDELESMLVRGLSRSRLLVVLANAGTLAEPRVVRKEVEEFRRLVPDGRILPISLSGALSPAEDDKAATDLTRSADTWLRFRDRVWIAEDSADSPLERCSDSVVEQIFKTLVGTRANVKWRRLVAATLATLALLTVASLWLAQRATTAEREAVAELRRAVAMRLITEARLALDGATSERWTASLRKLLTGRALGAVREADAILNQQLEAHPPTLARIWDVGASISDFSLGADGKTIAIATEGTGLRLASDDEEAHTFKLQEDSGRLLDGVRAIPCADDEDCLILTTYKGAIHRLVGLSTGSPRVAWSGNTKGIVTSMGLSPDGTVAVTADGGLNFVSKNQLHAWDLNRREELWGEGGNFTALAVCPRSDLNILATGNADGDISIRRFATGEAVRTWRADEKAYRVNALAFDPDCKRLLSAYGYDPNADHMPLKDEHAVSVWDLGNASAKPVKLIGHRSFVMDIAVSPDGLLAASGSRDGEIRLWSLEHGRAQAMPLAASEQSYYDGTAKPELPLLGHRGVVSRLRFTPLGDRLYSAGADGRLLAWDMQAPTRGSRPWAADVAFELRDAANALAVVPKADMLLIGRENGLLSEYSLSNGAPRSDWPQPVSGRIQQIEVDPTERWAILAYWYGESLDLKYEVRELSTRKAVGPGWQHKDSHPYLAVFTPDGRRRVGCDSDGYVEVREMPEGTLVMREAFAKVSTPVEGLSIRHLAALCPSQTDYSYDRRRQVVAGDRFAKPTYFDAALVQSFSNPKTDWLKIGTTAEKDKVDLLAFAQNGRVLATASRSGEVHLWDADTGGALGTAMRFDFGTPVSIATTPGAERVAVLSQGTVRVFLTQFHDGRSVCAWLPQSELPGNWKDWVGERIQILPICERPRAVP